MKNIDLKIIEPQLPAVIELDDAWGHDAVTADQLVMPRLDVAQPTSSFLKPAKPQYVKDARMGDLINSMTGAVYEGAEGVELLYAHHTQLYTLWTLFDEGGGFHGTRAIDDPELVAEVKRVGKYPGDRVQRTGQRELMVPTMGGNVHAVEQYTLYMVYGSPTLTEDNLTWATATFKSISINAFDRFISTMYAARYNNRKIPFGAFRWHLTTEFDQRAAGEAYKLRLTLANGATALNPEPALIGNHDPRYLSALQFHDAVTKGDVAVDYAAEAVVDEAVPF